MQKAQTLERRRRRRTSTARSARDTLADRPVAFGTDLVPRPELVDRLMSAPQASLAVLMAPPGYGKTAVLDEWADQDDRAFVWIRINSAQSRDIEITVSAIIAALGEAGMMEPETSAALRSLVCLGAADVLTGAMQCVCAQRSVVVVLDDAHTLPQALFRKVVEPVLRGLSPGSMLAVASRTRPPIPISRLRAGRALVEITAADLALTPAEAGSLLRKVGVELDLEAVQALVRRTEGWPAALYLAALSLTDHPELAADSSRFGGDDHLLSEFLRDEVMTALPAGSREFLMQTAILDELSGPLCDLVAERHGSAADLERLVGSTNLLLPVDSTHETYRCHRLLRDALRGELRRVDPELEARLHRRASRWYASEGDLDHAIEHAVAAGDSELVGDLLWPSLLSYVTRGQAGRVQSWLSGLSQDAIVDSAPLAVSAAHTALALGRLDVAQRWALSARSALTRQPVPDGLTSLSAALTVVEALATRTEADQMRTRSARAYEHEPEDSPWRPVLCLVRGVAEYLGGNATAATGFLETGAELSGSAEPLIAVLCLSLEAVLAIEAKDWELAQDLSREAAEIIDAAGLIRCPLAALTFAVSAAVDAHQGRADEAKRDLRRGRDLLSALGDFIPWYGAAARILLAHASLSLADAVTARTLLAEASRLSRRVPEAAIFEHWFDEAWAYLDSLAESVLAGPSSLTIAELRILRFLPSHRSFREIGGQLGVSANTVKTQAHAVYRKLGAASRSEAVARASQAGLISH